MWGKGANFQADSFFLSDFFLIHQRADSGAIFSWFVLVSTLFVASRLAEFFGSRLVGWLKWNLPKR